MTKLFSFSLGIGTKNKNDQWLEVYYPQPLANIDTDTSAQLITAVSIAGIEWNGGNEVITLNETDLNQLADALVTHQQLELANIAAKLVSDKRDAVLTLLTTNDKPTTIPEAYQATPTITPLRQASPNKFRRDFRLFTQYSLDQ